MKDEAVMEINLEQAIQRLADVCVLLKRQVAEQDAKIAQHDASDAERDAKIDKLTKQAMILTRLVDSHQAEIQFLKKAREQGGIVQ